MSEKGAQNLEIRARESFFEENQSGSTRNPVGRSRAPIFTFFGTTFGQSGSSRDPVGHQFSSFWHHVWTCREAAKIIQKRAKTLQECCVYEFGCLSTLVPDWIPTGSRLAKSGAKKMQN